MIAIYDSSSVKHPFSDYTDLCWIHETDGCDKLTFNIKKNAKLFNLFEEEALVDYGCNEWVIKKIQDDTVSCELNFDFLKRTFRKEFSFTGKTLSSVLRDTLPSGWIIKNANITTVTTTAKLKYCTDFDIVYSCMSIFGVYFKWEMKIKTLTVIAQDTLPSSDSYLTDELNLRKIAFQGETTSLITRLYCYGCEGISIASVNGGKEYIENHEYSNNVICGVWTDDRYTNPESLLADGLKKLQTLSRPVRSYECDVVNLAKINPDYDFISLTMHKKIYLLDRERNRKVEHQVVKYKEYPEEPERDVITLSTVPGEIQKTVKTLSEQIDSGFESLRDSMTEEIQKSTDIIVGNAMNGYVKKINGEMFIADNDDLALAKNVWRWNLGGLGFSSNGMSGPFSLALTQDGKIVADFIKTGTLDGAIIKANSITADQINAKGLSIEEGVFSCNDGSNKVTVENGNLSFFTKNSSNEYLKYGYIKSVMDGNISTTAPVFKIAASSDASAIAIQPEYAPGETRSAIYIQYKTPMVESIKHSHYMYGGLKVEGSLLINRSIYYNAPAESGGGQFILMQCSSSGNLVIGNANQPGSVNIYCNAEKNINLARPCNVATLGYMIGGTDVFVYTTKTLGNGNNVKAIHSGVDGLNHILWGNVYLSAPTAVQSDEDVKSDIEYFRPEHEEFFKTLKPRTFKYKDGKSGRTHFGFIAQELKASIEQSGFTTDDVAAFIQIHDEDGSEVIKAIRYEEIVPLNTFMIQKCMNEISNLRKEINILKGVQ